MAEECDDDDGSYIPFLELVMMMMTMKMTMTMISLKVMKVCQEERNSRRAEVKEPKTLNQIKSILLLRPCLANLLRKM